MQLIDLNEQQQKAVSIVTGPVIVFAGAGSGKTRTLTFRIAHMIEKNIAPDKILAITFTNKATNEMRERLHFLVGERTRQLTISTFHALCAFILRHEITALGYKRHFEIIDEEDQLKVIKELLDAGDYNKKVFTPRSVRKRINTCKTFNIKSDIPLENGLIEKYEQLMFELNLLDFNDLLLKVRDLFMRFPDILHRYQTKYQYILVDEFQDTDLVQYQIIKMMAEKHRNLFVVGDDDQAIYGFRGAHYDNIRLFKTDFEEFTMVKLTQNYRSTQTILDGSNALIKHNTSREAKELFSEIPGQDDDVIIYQTSNDNEEVMFVTDNIKSLLKNGYQYRDIAVVYRSSFVARQFEMGFIQVDMPYRIFGGVSYLRRKEIKDMISYLRLVVFNDDILSFQRVVNEPTRGIGSKTVQTLLAFRKKNDLTLFDAIDAVDCFPDSKKKLLIEFKNLVLNWQEKLESLDLVALYEKVLEDTQYIEKLGDDETKNDRIENLFEFKSILYTIENSGEINTRTNKLIAAFDEAVLSDDKLQTQRHSADGITLSTVHSVKGLEFKAVFIVAFENGIFPNLYRIDDSNSIEDERRIAYVAATRAKRKLFLTCAHRRLMYGNFVNNQQSQFLIEFINKPFVEKGVPFVTRKPKKIQEPTGQVEYKVGDIVLHTVYGEGIVVSMQSETGQICFTKQGVIKKFDMTHQSISKKKI